MPDIPNKPFQDDDSRPAGIDDPVALKVSWCPAINGGASFKAERIVVSDDRIVVEKTTKAVVFSLVFVCLGTWSLLFSMYLVMKRENILWAVLLFGCGLLWGSAGIAFLKHRNRLTFDKSLGRYFFGKYKRHRSDLDRYKQGQLKDIYAIQIISKVCDPVSDQDVGFISYEANLVFPDGNRLNVMDHAIGKDVVDSSVKISEFLGVPLWQPEWEQNST